MAEKPGPFLLQAPSEHEKQILKMQLDADDVNVSFFGLFRYASRMDLAIMFVSAICAIVAGAALPLFTVSAYL
jgi:ATP-binding cassette subfamily B (MDR/TAP) protein 1